MDGPNQVYAWRSETDYPGISYINNRKPGERYIVGGEYREQLTWRDAATGKLLAASDFFEPLSINGLTPPGFGGRIYFPTAVGKGFYVLQVRPVSASMSGR
jgi:hypothetical protein